MGGESAYNTKQLEKTKKIEDMKKVEDRLIKVVFLADVAATMKWDFRPQQNQVSVSFNPLHTGVTLHDLLPSADFIKNPILKQNYKEYHQSGNCLLRLSADASSRQRISSDKTSNLTKRDIRFILLKYYWRN